LHYKAARDAEKQKIKSKGKEDSTSKKTEKNNDKFDNKNNLSKPAALSKSEVLRMCLATGFYYNSARKVIGNNDSYLL